MPRYIFDGGPVDPPDDSDYVGVCDLCGATIIWADMDYEVVPKPGSGGDENGPFEELVISSQCARGRG